jgi:hypothetical protein
MRSSTPNELENHARIPEEQEEATLRATLSERANLEVDSASDWRAITPRLRFETSERSGHLPRRRRAFGRISGAWRDAWPRTWAGAGLAALTLVALVSAGFAAFEWAGPFVGQKLGLIGEQRLYTDVNESRDDAGVTIFVDKAYADPGNVYIAFRMRPDQPVAGSFSPGSFDLTSQSDRGSNGGANIECQGRSDPSAAQVCVLDSSPLQPDAGGKMVTITLDIHTIYRIPSSGHSQTIPGDWNFVFTIPFHTRNFGPGGPYAQPA